MDRKKTSLKTVRRSIRGRKMPNTVELMEIYREMVKRPNVFGCYVGKKISRGEKKPGLAVICAVKDKVDKENLSREEIIPSRFGWLKHASSPQKMRTDVVQMSDTLTRQTGPIIGPGDRIVRKANGEAAAIGIAFLHPQYGPVVTTAGHLFSGNGVDEDVTIESGDSQVNGKMVKKMMAANTDCALIQITNSSMSGVENLFRDLHAVGPLYFPSDQDLEKEMVVLTPTGAFDVICKGINGQFSWSNGILMNDLILTTWKTIPGDSGSCLVTKKYAACGLLVGQMSSGDTLFSAFVPAYIPVLMEHGQLI